MNRRCKKDFSDHPGLYSEPLEVGNGDFIFTIRGHNKLWMHIYLGKQDIQNDDGYTSHQLLILNHPTIGIYHDYDAENRRIGIDVKTVGVDLL